MLDLIELDYIINFLNCESIEIIKLIVKLIYK